MTRIVAFTQSTWNGAVASLAAVLVGACSPHGNDLDSGYLSSTSPFDTNARLQTKILAASAADTVWQWRVNDVSTVVWTNSGEERWRSEYAYRTEPYVELTPVDQDSVLDLFWSIDEEGGPVGGMVLLTTPNGVRTAFVSPADACLPPTLTDVNRDRIPDVIHYAPGLIDADSCRTFSYEACEERYATEWRQAYVQLDGEFKADETEALAFYRQTSMLYLHSAGRLQRHLAGLSLEAVAAQVCDSTMVAGLAEMSRRAAHISGRTSPY